LTLAGKSELGTRDTVARVCGVARVCRIRYRTRTRKTRDPKPVGFSEPVINPNGMAIFV
jgi:hypothetical protein